MRTVKMPNANSALSVKIGVMNIINSNSGLIEASLGAYVVQCSRASLCLVIYPIESWLHRDHHEYH